ncbi:TetR/AcrR family transcriptional regulator [Jannaschia sp. R86511]|uniref:TetR/AcrR family transcriptional regulator n=1 Tax=Jannaschia sp. R86511 TaxID=3093853 RepID=UPI0036D402D7
MARTVDPERHAARRLQIVDAALTCFAADGYDGATTAAICRTAGIGSGTFFHYFPTKADVLLGILALGTQETRDWFAAQAGRDDPLAVLRDWVRWSADELADPRLPGFVRAVGAVMTQPAVAAALARDEQAQQEGLVPWVDRARSAGQVRRDRSAAELASWLALVLDGFVGRLAGGDGFTVQGQRDMLLDAVDRLLEPR